MKHRKSSFNTQMDAVVAYASLTSLFSASSSDTVEENSGIDVLLRTVCRFVSGGAASPRDLDHQEDDNRVMGRNKSIDDMPPSRTTFVDTTDFLRVRSPHGIDLERLLGILGLGASHFPVLRQWIWQTYAALPSEEHFWEWTMRAAQMQEWKQIFASSRPLDESVRAFFLSKSLSSWLGLAKKPLLDSRVRDLLLFSSEPPPLSEIPPILALFVIQEDADRRREWLHELSAQDNAQIGEKYEEKISKEAQVKSECGSSIAVARYPSACLHFQWSPSAMQWLRSEIFDQLLGRAESSSFLRDLAREDLLLFMAYWWAVELVRESSRGDNSKGLYSLRGLQPAGVLVASEKVAFDPGKCSSTSESTTVQHSADNETQRHFLARSLCTYEQSFFNPSVLGSQKDASSATTKDPNLKRAWKGLLKSVCGARSTGHGYLAAVLQPIRSDLLFPSFLSSDSLWSAPYLDLQEECEEDELVMEFSPSFQLLLTNAVMKPETNSRTDHSNETSLAPPSCCPSCGCLHTLITSNSATLVTIVLRCPEAQLMLMEQWWRLAVDEMVEKKDDQSPQLEQWKELKEEREDAWQLRVTAVLESFRCAQLVGIPVLASFEASPPSEGKQCEPSMKQASRTESLGKRLALAIGIKRPRFLPEDAVEECFWKMISVRQRQDDGKSEGNPFSEGVLVFSPERYNGLEECIDRTNVTDTVKQEVVLERTTQHPIGELIRDVQDTVTKSFYQLLYPMLKNQFDHLQKVQGLKEDGADRCFGRTISVLSPPFTAAIQRVVALLESINGAAAPSSVAESRTFTIRAVAATCGAFCGYSILRWLVLGIHLLSSASHSHTGLRLLFQKVHRLLSSHSMEEASSSCPAAQNERERWPTCIVVTDDEVQLLAQLLRHISVVARGLNQAWGREYGFYLCHRLWTKNVLLVILNEIGEFVASNSGSAVTEQTRTALTKILASFTSLFLM